MATSFILMHPDDSEESRIALEISKQTGVNSFDVAMDRRRLQLIELEYKIYYDAESHHDSCIGEIDAGRWAIYKNKINL